MPKQTSNFDIENEKDEENVLYDNTGTLEYLDSTKVTKGTSANNDVISHTGVADTVNRGASSIDTTASELLDNKVNYGNSSGITSATRTASGSSSGTTSANTTAASTNKYYDTIADYTSAQQKNSQGYNTSGLGYESPTDEGYSWEQKGASEALTQYQSDIQTQRSTYIQQKQSSDILGSISEKQEEVDMQKYADNQEAEKVGWTGGYVLDQARQRQYLESSIKAQLYGAMELQKYGYSSALAAARLSYDLNQKQYAEEYYTQAVANALQEAETTGVYFSAEVSDLLSQRSVAQSILDDETNTNEEERANAERIIKQVNDWFSDNNISEEGIKTSAQVQYDVTNETQRATDLYNRYMAAKEALDDTVDDSTVFFKLDENGNVIFDGQDVETMDFSTATSKDALEYAISSQSAAKQMYSYFNSIVEAAIAKYKSDNTSVDSTTKTETYNGTAKGMSTAVRDAITSKIEKFETAIDGLDVSDDDKKLMQTLLDNWSYNPGDINADFTIKNAETGEGIKTEDDDSSLYDEDGNYLYTNPTNGNTAKYYFPAVSADSTKTAYSVKYVNGATSHAVGNGDVNITVGNTTYELEMSGAKVTENNSKGVEIPSTENRHDGEIVFTGNGEYCTLMIYDGNSACWRYLQMRDGTSSGTDYDKVKANLGSLLQSLGYTDSQLRVTLGYHYYVRGYSDGGAMPISVMF